jgi:hypothetical protein
MPAPHVIAIPIQEVRPHPKLAFRFRYDVDSLADSIIATADDNTPNGQLNPGRVVRTANGDGYYVYVGVRRFLALKLALGRTKDQRFGVFNAYVDEGLSELQMFIKAKAENEEEKGERVAPSLLEQVSGIRNIRDGIDPGKAPPSIRRLLALAERMDKQRLQRLREAEWATKTGFTQPQLEGLSRIDGGDSEFYTTAATMVAFGEQDAEVARTKREAAFHLNWFSRAFPEIKKETPNQKKENEDGETDDEGGAELEVHEDGVILAICPKCGGANMLKVKGQLELTHISPDPKGEARTIVAEAVGRVRLACSHCAEESFVLVEYLGGGTYAVSATESGEFREPDEKTDALDLRFDFDKKKWERVAGGKIVGEVLLAPGMRRR